MSLKALIKTNYQYFLIPLTYLAVWVTSTINYLYCGMPKQIIKTTILAALIWLIFIMLIPVYIDELLGWKFINSVIFFWVYLYFISIPVSIYLIKNQKQNNIL